MKTGNQSSKIRQYYSIHAQVYDATRWTFLFGRDAMLSHPALSVSSEKEDSFIMEIGCGTGRNLARIANIYPKAQLAGIDMSPHMLAHARQATSQYGSRIRLINQPYNLEHASEQYSPADLLLFSYALSMFNPGWEEALQRVNFDLNVNGQIAVVDFHRSRYRWFTRWMKFNHVRMDGHLYEALHEHFEPVHARTYRAMGGLWEYFIFIGNRKA